MALAGLLKQTTAAVISFGPFVDKTDNVTLKTGQVSSLDNGTTGIKLSKNGGALTIRHATVTTTTYDAYGCYLVTLDTTDTNTLGILSVQMTEAATHLPVRQDYMVLPANIYNSLVGGSDLIDVSVVQNAGSAITSASGVQEVKVASIANNALTAAAINADAITAAKVASDVTAEIADGIWDEARSGHVAIGSFGQAMQGVIRSSTAQAGASGTITLDISASSTNDAYNGLFIVLLAGTGSGQVRQITGYVGGTRVATISPNWVTAPDATTVFAITQ